MSATKQSYFWVQSMKEGHLPEIVPHSKDDETGEDYYQFLSRAKANKHLKEVKKGDPNRKYRVVRQVVQYFSTNWE